MAKGAGKPKMPKGKMPIGKMPPGKKAPMGNMPMTGGMYNKGGKVGQKKGC